MKFIEHPAFTFAGLSTRTSNADEMAGKGRIAAVWGRFYSEGLLEKIPNRSDPGAVLALYTEYDSDANAPYTFAVGVKVDRASGLPPGFATYTIPAAKYAVFTSDRGPIPAIIFDVWKAIWSSPIQRAYGSDFEVHYRSNDQNNAHIEVWVSIK